VRGTALPCGGGAALGLLRRPRDFAVGVVLEQPHLELRGGWTSGGWRWHAAARSAVH